MAIELKNIVEVDEQIQWQVRNWRNSTDISQYFILDYITEEMHSNWLQRLKEGQTDYAYIVFNEHQPIGCAYFRNINNIHKTAEVGIFITVATEIKGIGSLVMPKINEIGFKVLQLEKIYLEVLDTNTRAMKLYKKFGYEIEGVLKSHIVKSNNRLNIILMALLKDDWEQSIIDK